MVRFPVLVLYFQRKRPQVQMLQVVCTGCKAGLNVTIMSNILVLVQNQTSSYYFTALVSHIFFCACNICAPYVHESWL